MNILEWLDNWYRSMCDGSWEHSFGIKIDTLDNPGWLVSIDIVNTPLEEKKFNTTSKYIDDTNWVYCQVKDGKFNGGGDTSKLEYILEIFKKWVES